MWTMAKRSGVKGAPSFTVGRSFMVTWSGEVMFGCLLMFKINDGDDVVSYPTR